MRFCLVVMVMSGKQLRDVRLSVGLKQTAFAELLNCSERQLQYFETGEKPIDQGTARIAAWIAIHGIEFPWKAYGLMVTAKR